MFEVEDGPEMPEYQRPVQPNPSLYDKQFFVSLLASLLRFVLAGVGGWFVRNGIGTQGDWEFLIAGLAFLIVTAISILWSRYHARLKYLAALAAGPNASDEYVKAAASELANETLVRRKRRAMKGTKES